MDGPPVVRWTQLTTDILYFRQRISIHYPPIFPQFHVGVAVLAIDIYTFELNSTFVILSSDPNLLVPTYIQLHDLVFRHIVCEAGIAL